MTLRPLRLRVEVYPNRSLAYHFLATVERILAPGIEASIFHRELRSVNCGEVPARAALILNSFVSAVPNLVSLSGARGK
jgi:hypothetical protein